MKAKARNKNNQLVVRVKLSSSEVIDDEELDMICRVFVREFLRPSIYKNKVIDYKGSSAIALRKFLKKPLSKYEFLFIMHQIMIAVLRVQNSGLHLNRLWLNVDTVFIDEMTKELHFIYLPVHPLSDNMDVMSFMETIGHLTKPVSDTGDSDFVSRFMYFLTSMTVFDGSKIEKYIEREDNRITRAVRYNDIRKNENVPNGEPKDNVGNFGQLRSHHSEETTAFGIRNGESTFLLSNDSDETTALLDENESTALLNNDGETELLHYPTLQRMSTGEIITINKPVFRLGKDTSCAEYAVTNNNTISGSHADIVSRDDRYYVVDLNSKNKSYINNRMLPAQYEVEIFDGDTLKLSNEEFIFHT